MKPSNLTLATIHSNELLGQQIQFKLYKEFTDFLIAYSGDSEIFSEYIHEAPNENDEDILKWVNYFGSIYSNVASISFTNHYNEVFVVDGPTANIHPWYWIIHVIAKMKHNKSTINTNDHIKWKCVLHLKSGSTLTVLYHGYVINLVTNEIIKVLKDSIFNRFYSNLYLKKLQRTMNSVNFHNIPSDVYHHDLIAFSKELREAISVDDVSYYSDVFKQMFKLFTGISNEITVTIDGMSGFEVIGKIVNNKTMVIELSDLYHKPKLEEIYFKDGEFNPIGIIKNTKRIIDENLNKINITDFKY